MRFLVWSVIALVSATPAQAFLLKCEDSKGNVTFSNKGCPKEARRVQHIKEFKSATPRGSGVRRGEKLMLKQANERRARELEQKKRANRRFMENHKTYSERLKERERRMKRFSKIP